MRRLIACSLLIVLLAGCSSGPGGGATSPAAPPSATNTPRSGTDINDSYDVGGYKLDLTCSGTGESTVVYLHGLGGEGSDVNEAIAPRLAGRVRLCTYDRVNVGQSDDQSARHTGADSVRDLHALLGAAKVEGSLSAGRFLLRRATGGHVRRYVSGRHDGSPDAGRQPAHRR